jgi:hypothetical protein
LALADAEEEEDRGLGCSLIGMDVSS